MFLFTGFKSSFDVSPLITTAVDVLGVFIYLMVARLILHL